VCPCSELPAGRWGEGQHRLACPTCPVRYCRCGPAGHQATQPCDMHRAAVSKHKDVCCHSAGCVFLGGQVSCTGPGASIHCEDCHFSGYFLGHACLAALAHVTLHRCTVQVGGHEFKCSLASIDISGMQLHPSLVLLEFELWATSGMCGQREGGSLAHSAEQAHHACISSSAGGIGGGMQKHPPAAGFVPGHSVHTIIS
jgi:hypothetical protein